MTSRVSPSCRPYLLDTLNLFEKSGISIPIVSGKAPNAFSIHEISEITDLCVGTSVFCGLSHVYWDVCKPPDSTLIILTTVLSILTPDCVILDAETKILTMNSRTQPNPPRNQVYGVIEDYPDTILYRLSEGHGPLNTANTGRRFKVGEKVQVIPINSRAAVGISDTFALVRGNRVLEILPICARRQMK